MKPSNEKKYANLSNWIAVRDAGLDPGGRRPTDDLLFKPSGVDPFPVMPRHNLPRGFGGLYGNPEEQRARQRRIDANRVLEKYGAR